VQVQQVIVQHELPDVAPSFVAVAWLGEGLTQDTEALADQHLA